jgi:hypothetical protein
MLKHCCALFLLLALGWAGAHTPTATPAAPATVERRGLFELSLQALAGAPFNKERMLVYPQSAETDRHPPPHFQFAGQAPSQWDHSRFNPAFWQHLEKRVGQLRDLGIQADLIIHHPYDDLRAWGFDSLPRAVDERYVRHLVARFAAFRNVWWSLANEWDFVRTKTEADWERLGQLVQRSDPYGHLLSIHNGKRLFDHNRPWITHVSLQNGMAAAEASRAVWLAQGAHLVGESPPRLAFLKQVLALPGRPHMAIRLRRLDAALPAQPEPDTDNN